MNLTIISRTLPQRFDRKNQGVSEVKNSAELEYNADPQATAWPVCIRWKARHYDIAESGVLQELPVTFRYSQFLRNWP